MLLDITAFSRRSLLTGATFVFATFIVLGGAARSSSGAEPASGAVLRASTTAVPTNEELARKVEALETEVKQLRAKDAVRSRQFESNDIDAVTASVLEDAGRHTFNFPPGGSSGHDLDKGFFIKGDDGRFALYPDLLFQFRGVVNYREGAKAGGNSSTENGFEVRRAKFGFYGTAFDPDFSYRFLWQNNPATGAVVLQYAWGQYLFAHNLGKGDLGIRAGQFKNVVFKEETTPDRSQLLVERSLVNSLLGGGALGSETQGVDLLYTGNDSPLHVDLLIHNGIKRSNTSFDNEQPIATTSGGVTTTKNVSTNFGVAGRIDYKLFGRWGDGDDLTGVWGRENLLVVGGGADFTQADHNNIVHWTADAQYQLHHKISLFAGAYGNFTDFRNQAGPGNRHDFGGQIEAGYFVTRSIQPVVRYSVTRFDKDFRVGGTRTFQEFAGGVNWFLGNGGQLGNRAKVTVDVTYLPDGTPAFAGGDFLASPNKKEEVVLRAQLQLSL